MAISGLTNEDHEVIRACLAAMVDIEFIPEWEFQIITGIERLDVAAVLDAWPDPVPAVTERVATRIGPTEVQDLVVNNVLNNLLGYPHGMHDQLAKSVPGAPDSVATALAHWRGESGFNRDPVGYADRIR